MKYNPGTSLLVVRSKNAAVKNTMRQNCTTLVSVFCDKCIITFHSEDINSQELLSHPNK